MTGRKQCFFEKKHQETFTRFGGTRAMLLVIPPRATDKSFLVLFFKKALLPYYGAAHSAHRPSIST
jgi:hypothetical protein